MTSKEKKAKLFEEVDRNLTEGSGVILADFKGLTVLELMELRKKVEKEGAIPKVVKNTILEKVFDKHQIKEYEKFTRDNTIAFFPREDFIKTLKVVVDYAKQNEKLVLKGVYFDGQLFDKKMAIELSKLPSKKELIGMVVGSIQGIISGFVGTLNSVITTFVGTIEAIEKKKKD